ncbi:MAG: hypothetical protein U0R76_16680 [Candidatus Nanopelagicales bacterium]
MPRHHRAIGEVDDRAVGVPRQPVDAGAEADPVPELVGERAGGRLDPVHHTAFLGSVLHPQGRGEGAGGDAGVQQREERQLVGGHAHELGQHHLELVPRVGVGHLGREPAVEGERVERVDVRRRPGRVRGHRAGESVEGGDVPVDS